MQHFIQGNIYRKGQFSKGDLWVSGAKIAPPGSSQAQVIDVQGNYIIPGLIDLQVNGAFGRDFTKEPARLEEVSSQLGKFGVTSFLATLVSSSPSTYKTTIPEMQKFIGKNEGAELLGIHLEGPCFHPDEHKAHMKSYIAPCSDFLLPETCYGDLSGVKLVTLAPDCDGAFKWIELLTKKGILVSGGHSRASAEQMEIAIDKGVSMATHLFNAMGPFHHRSSGIVGAVLTRPGFYYSLIADGFHLDPRVVKIAWQAQPKGLILVSDSIGAAGMRDGEYFLGEKTIRVANGQAITEQNTLAGCTLGLAELLVKFCKMTGASLEAVIPCVTEKPARFLNLYPKKGSLDVGSDADFTILNRDFEVVATYARGKQCF